MRISLVPIPSRKLGDSRNVVSDTTWAIGAKATNQSCDANAPMDARVDGGCRREEELDGAA
jgi:hypothetical protein